MNNNEQSESIGPHPANDPLPPNLFHDLWLKFLSSATVIDPEVAGNRIDAFEEWWRQIGATNDKETFIISDIANFAREEIRKREINLRWTLFSVSELLFSFDNQHLKLAASLLLELMDPNPPRIADICDGLHETHRPEFSKLMNARLKASLLLNDPQSDLPNVPLAVREAFRKSAWDSFTGEPKELVALANEWTVFLAERGVSVARHS